MPLAFMDPHMVELLSLIPLLIVTLLLLTIKDRPQSLKELLLLLQIQLLPTITIWVQSTNQDIINKVVKLSH